MAPSGKLRGKGRCGVFAGKTVWSTPERLIRGEVFATRRYTNLRLPLPLLVGLIVVAAAVVVIVVVGVVVSISSMWQNASNMSTTLHNTESTIRSLFWAIRTHPHGGADLLFSPRSPAYTASRDHGYGIGASHSVAAALYRTVNPSAVTVYSWCLELLDI